MGEGICTFGMPFHSPMFCIMLTLLPFQRVDPMASESQEPSEIRDHAEADRNSRLGVNEPVAYDNGQRSVKAPSREVNNRRDILDIVEGLVRKFEDRPQCFHLEWPPGKFPTDVAVYWIVECATGCVESTSLDGTQPSTVDDVRVTECRCGLSGRNKSQDPWHVAYQEACSKLVKTYISRFEELSQRGAEDSGTIWELTGIFMNLTVSALLKHCDLDTELFSLCRTFFGLAKGCLTMRIDSDGRRRGTKNMLEWFEVSIFLWNCLPTVVVLYHK